MSLKIRGENDEDPPLITNNIEVLKDTATHIVINAKPQSQNTSVLKDTAPHIIRKLWTMVINKVTDVIDYVMNESTDSDECDGCDGILQKSSKTENKREIEAECNTKNERNLERTETLEEVSNMPSQVEQPQARSHTEQDIENSQSAITVGDLVTVEDCPGHWGWASPFTVEAIEGEMAKLEMVGELVEIARLLKCQR